MKIMSRILSSKAVRQYAMISVGCVLGAASYPLFLQPNQIAPGGLTGVTTILNFYTGLPIGLGSLILNVPLFMVGWRIIGMRFIIRTLISTLLFSSLIDLLKLQPLSMDPMLASVSEASARRRPRADHAGTRRPAAPDCLPASFTTTSAGCRWALFCFRLTCSSSLPPGSFWARSTPCTRSSACLSAQVLDQVLVGIGWTRPATSSAGNPAESKASWDWARVWDHAAGAYSGRDIKVLLRGQPL